ncbi:MAG: DUF1697 domain-containing protein [Paludibacteraceae bacterium]
MNNIHIQTPIGLSEKKMYFTLLRGVNVGGNNIVKMNDLKAAFEDMGFSHVKTYIQSGNIIFSSENNNKTELIYKIEKNLSDRFNYNSIIVLLTKDELEEQVLSAPADYGNDPENYRYDVILLKETTTVENALKDIKLRDGIDEIFIGSNILFFRRLFTNLTKSKLTKIVASPVYKHITIRNWNTMTKLLEIMRNS